MAFIRAIAAATAALRGSVSAPASAVAVCGSVDVDSDSAAFFSAWRARACAFRASRAAITALLSGAWVGSTVMLSAADCCFAFTRAKAALTALLSSLSGCTAAFLCRASRASFSLSIRICLASNRSLASLARRSSWAISLISAFSWR